MKKYIIYIGILVVGLLLGWLIFGNSSNENTEQNQSNAVQKPIKCGRALCIHRLCNQNQAIVLFVVWI